MNKYKKDDIIINATEKAYNVIYKNQGYVPFKEKGKSKKKEEASE